MWPEQSPVLLQNQDKLKTPQKKAAPLLLPVEQVLQPQLCRAAPSSSPFLSIAPVDSSHKSYYTAVKSMTATAELTQPAPLNTDLGKYRYPSNQSPKLILEMALNVNLYY